jgi:hypothetical protein
VSTFLENALVSPKVALKPILGDDELSPQAPVRHVVRGELCSNRLPRKVQFIGGKKSNLSAIDE